MKTKLLSYFRFGIGLLLMSGGSYSSHASIPPPQYQYIVGHQSERQSVIYRVFEGNLDPLGADQVITVPAEFETRVEVINDSQPKAKWLRVRFSNATESLWAPEASAPIPRRSEQVYLSALGRRRISIEFSREFKDWIASLPPSARVSYLEQEYSGSHFVFTQASKLNFEDLQASVLYHWSQGQGRREPFVTVEIAETPEAEAQARAAIRGALILKVAGLQKSETKVEHFGLPATAELKPPLSAGQKLIWFKAYDAIYNQVVGKFIKSEVYKTLTLKRADQAVPLQKQVLERAVGYYLTPDTPAPEIKNCTEHGDSWLMQVLDKPADIVDFETTTWASATVEARFNRVTEY